MGLARPQILALLLLLPVVWPYLRPPGRRFLGVLRTLLVVGGLLYLSGPYLRRAEPGVDVVVVVDRSASMGRAGQERVRELLRLLGRTRGSEDRLAVVGFGEKAVLEAAPSAGPPPEHAAREVGGHGSDLAAALELAGSLRAAGRVQRFLVLSDGGFTGRDPSRADVLGGCEGAAVWFRQISRPAALDVAAGVLEVPGEVQPHVGFTIRFSIWAARRGACRYRLARGREVVVSGAVDLRLGWNRFVARDVLAEPGLAEYELVVEDGADPLPENNRATALVRCVGEAGVLLVSGRGGDGGWLAATLREVGLTVAVVRAAAAPREAAALTGYGAVILENCPLQRLPRGAVRALGQAVERGLLGLLVTGGPQAFGEGGYHRSPLDPLLPVTLELPEEQRRGMLALALVMDRSGSMAVQLAGGETKMDLANLAAAEAIRLLSPLDNISVIAVDSAPHTIVPLARADRTAGLIEAVLSIQSEGGGIFVRSGLAAGLAELEKSPLPTRHLILFADAADAEEPGGCLDLARGLAGSGGSLSVVGLGRPGDRDADFLRDLAAAGGGEIYFTTDARALPQLFSQEVIRVSQRGYVAQVTPVTPRPDLVALGVDGVTKVPATGGYNLTALRGGASCALQTAEGDRVPLCAFWQRGGGAAAVLCYEVDGPHTGALSAWPEHGRLLRGLLRYLMTASGRNDASHVAAAWEDGELRIRVEWAPEDLRRLAGQTAEALILPPAGREPMRVPLTWQGNDRAVGSVPLVVPGHYIPTLSLPTGDDGGSGDVLVGPAVGVPYSPEYAPGGSARGRSVLKRLAQRTGGDELMAAGAIFAPPEGAAGLGRRRLAPWIAAGLVVLGLLAMAERRLRWGGWVWRRGGNH